MWFQSLSLVHSLSRHGIWSSPKPAFSMQRAADPRLPLILGAGGRDRSGVRLALGGLLGRGLGGGLAGLLAATRRRPRPRGARLAASLAAAARQLRLDSAVRCFADCDLLGGLPLALVLELGLLDSGADLRGQALLLGLPVVAQVDDRRQRPRRAVRQRPYGRRAGSTADSRSGPFVGGKDTARGRRPGRVASASRRPDPVPVASRRTPVTAGASL